MFEMLGSQEKSQTYEKNRTVRGKTKDIRILDKSNMGYEHMPENLIGATGLYRNLEQPVQFRNPLSVLDNRDYNVRVQKKNNVNNNIVQRCCIQFEPEYYKRILALLNINERAFKDPNNIIFKALCDLGFIGGNGRENIDIYAYLKSIKDEGRIGAIEERIITWLQGEKIESIYGPLSGQDKSSNFSGGFNGNHFAPDFKTAFEISKNRFTTDRKITTNTVICEFQKENFMNNEYIKITDTQEEGGQNDFDYTTMQEYYFWEFRRSDLGQNFDSLQECNFFFKGKLDLKINYDKTKRSFKYNIYHMAGAQSKQQATPMDHARVAEKLGPAVWDLKVIAEYFQEIPDDKIEEALGESLQIPEKSEGSEVLSAIFNFIGPLFNMIGTLPNKNNEYPKSEILVYRAFGRSVSNFFSAFSTFNYENFCNAQLGTGRYVSSYFEDIYNRLAAGNVRETFSKLGCKSLYDDMLSKVKEVNDEIGV